LKPHRKGMVDYLLVPSFKVTEVTANGLLDISSLDLQYGNNVKKYRQQYSTQYILKWRSIIGHMLDGRHTKVAHTRRLEASDGITSAL